MASGGSGGRQAPLGITLPDWMKRKTPDRYAFDETPFSPPSPQDEFFLIKYPLRNPEQEKKSSYETINSLTAAVRSASLDVSTADALATSTTASGFGGGGGGKLCVSTADEAAEKKVRRNSAVTVLPGGQVSIKTYGESAAAATVKKTSDPGAYYGDYANLHTVPQRFGSGGEQDSMDMPAPEDAAYESDCSVASSSGAPPPTGTMFGAIGHHLSDLTTGGHGIMDYFHFQDEEDAAAQAAVGREMTPPSASALERTRGSLGHIASEPIVGAPLSAGERHRRLGLGAFGNPFFTDGSTMSVFSGLYQKDNADGGAGAGAGALDKPADGGGRTVVPATSSGGIVAGLVGTFAANRSSSAYDSQLAAGSGTQSDVEMESVGRVDRNRAKRWAPKPSKQRELNLFAPCSS